MDDFFFTEVHESMMDVCSADVHGSMIEICFENNILFGALQHCGFSRQPFSSEP